MRAAQVSPPSRADVDAADADADGDMAAVARVDLDGDRAGMIAPGAEPMRVAGVLPERLDQMKGIAAVIADEEAARIRAEVEAIRLVRAAGLDQPDVVGLGGHAEIGRDGIAFGILGRFDFLPAGAAIARAVQLAAPVPVIQADPDGVRARIAEGVDDRDGFEMRRFDLPVAAPSRLMISKPLRVPTRSLSVRLIIDVTDVGCVHPLTIDPPAKRSRIRLFPGWPCGKCWEGELDRWPHSMLRMRIVGQF